MDFLSFPKCPNDFFLQHHPSTHKILTSTTNIWNLTCFFIQEWNILSLARVTEFAHLNSQLFFFLYLVLLAEKKKKILLLPRMYRYIFNFTLKLITTLLQKLAIFHIWNVKQKNDGMDQNTLHCCNDNYVGTN